MEELSASFPQGLEYRILYNPTEFISQSIDAVLHTLLEAVVLVVLVTQYCLLHHVKNVCCSPLRN